MPYTHEDSGGFYEKPRWQQQAENDGHVYRRDPQTESGGFYEKTRAERQAELDNDVHSNKK